MVTVNCTAGRCELSGVLDFSTARAALDAVAPSIQRESELVINLAGLTDSNSAGLALLVEWRALARHSGHDVRFENIPDGLTQLARVCQVDSLI